MQAKIERDLLLQNDKDLQKKIQDEKMEEANNMICHSQNAMAMSLGVNGGRFSIRDDPTNTIKNSVSLEKVSSNETRNENNIFFSNFFFLIKLLFEQQQQQQRLNRGRGTEPSINDGSVPPEAEYLAMQDFMLTTFKRMWSEKKNFDLKKKSKKSNETKKLVFHNGPVYRDTSLTQLWGQPTDASSKESSKNVGTIEEINESTDDESVDSSIEKKS